VYGYPGHCRPAILPVKEKDRVVADAVLAKHRAISKRAKKKRARRKPPTWWGVPSRATSPR
jgi:hypothetical protein